MQRTQDLYHHIGQDGVFSRPVLRCRRCWRSAQHGSQNRSRQLDQIRLPHVFERTLAQLFFNPRKTTTPGLLGCNQGRPRTTKKDRVRCPVARRHLGLYQRSSAPVLPSGAAIVPPFCLCAWCLRRDTGRSRCGSAVLANSNVLKCGAVPFLNPMINSWNGR